jgi:hypothetical protein
MLASRLWLVTFIIALIKQFYEQHRRDESRRYAQKELFIQRWLDIAPAEW